MQYEGTLIKILPLEKVGQNNTEKRTFILEENRDSEYKGGLAIDLWGDKITMIEQYKEGDIINVSLNAKVREYNGKWYNSISAWKIEAVQTTTKAHDNDEPFIPPSTESDDLPF